VNHEIVLNKQQAQQVISIFLEAGVSISAGLTKALAKTLRAYATWQGLNSIVIDWADSEALRLGLTARLADGQTPGSK